MDTKTKPNSILVFFASIFFCPIGALIFMWYNWVLFRPVLHFWQWVILCAAIMLVRAIVPILNWTLGMLISAVFGVTVIAQAMFWCHLIKLPLIH
jgi:hypothetical protein